MKSHLFDQLILLLDFNNVNCQGFASGECIPCNYKALELYNLVFGKKKQKIEFLFNCSWKERYFKQFRIFPIKLGIFSKLCQSHEANIPLIPCEIVRAIVEHPSNEDPFYI